MKISAIEIKPGNIIEHKNDLYLCLKTQHVKSVQTVLLSDSLSIDQKILFNKIGAEIIKEVYKEGFLAVVSQNRVANKDALISITKENVVKDIPFKNLYNSNKVLKIL